MIRYWRHKFVSTPAQIRADLVRLAAANLLRYDVSSIGFMTWSPDGAHLSGASTNQTVRIWNPATGHTITSLTSHTDDVNAAAWSPDGACLATAGSDRTVRIWDTITWQHRTVQLCSCCGLVSQRRTPGHRLR